MQLTKLRAAPVLRAEVPPCAPAGRTEGGTASQLIRSVRRTRVRLTEPERDRRCPEAGLRAPCRDGRWLGLWSDMEAAMTIRRSLACGSLVWLLAAPAAAADGP